MKISLKYGDSVLSLPAKAVAEHLSEATREELCVLLALAGDPSADADELCERLNISNEEFMKAVSFWRGGGAMSVSLDEGEKLPANRKKSDRTKKTATGGLAKHEDLADMGKHIGAMLTSNVPAYSTSDIAEFLEKDTSLRTYIENCQQIMGKIFNVGEASVLIGIVQYLGVTTDYVALLCAFSISHGKKSVRYVEKLALSFYDEGITKYKELETHLKCLNRAEELQPTVRNMFGIGDRALTAKEKKLIEHWCGELELDVSLIRKAYEITVTNTGKASMPYCNSILESWNSSGCKTVAEVDAAMAEFKKGKSRSEGSFDTSDFFEAALRRSNEITGGTQ